MATVPRRQPRAGQHTVDPRVEKMPDEFLECRADGHMFRFSKTRRQRVRELTQRGGTVDTVHYTATCAGCGSVRITVRCEQDYELLRRWYEYADGYTEPQDGAGQIPRAVAALELQRRYPPE